MRCLVLVGLLTAAGCSHDDSVDERKCTQLRDHLIDVRLSGAELTEDADRAQHRAAMKQALGDTFIADCKRNMSNEQLNCALKATDLNGASDCSHRSFSSR
jgi:hypothetical protein